MYKIISSLSFLILFIPEIHAQWDGTSDLPIDLSTLTNQTYDNTISVIAPMIISGTTLDVSCAQNDTVNLTAVDKGSALEITICGATHSFDYLLNKVTLTNGNGVKLNFEKGQTDVDYPFDFTINPDTLNVYYDAIVLEKGSTKQKKIIYKKYKLTASSPEKNVFLALMVDELSGLQSADNLPTNFGSSSAKGINITKFADGFAKFIASQFKKELTISFFNSFRDKLNDPDVRDLSVLFKNTFAELNLIGDKFTQYEAYLSSLRQSMEYDCHELPQQFEKLLGDTTSQLSEALEAQPDFQYVLYNVLAFGLEISDSVNIGKALADLDFSANISARPVDQNLKGSLETVQLLSEGLRNIKTGPSDSYWISKSKMKGLLKDTSLLNLFLALLSEKANLDNIKLTSKPLFDILTSSKVEQVKELVESVVFSIASIEDIYSSTKGKITAGEKDLLALKYFDAASELLNSSNHLAPLLSKSEATKLRKYNTFTSNINDMTRAFVTQKYSIGLLHLSQVLTEIDSTSKSLQKIKSVINRQGLFIAQMAESDNSDDVATILENFAAPTGSWRDKRTAKWNIAMDSYIGPAVYKIKDKDPSFAFSTPVGASVTIPFNYVTFFVSVVDLGPLTSFRLTNDTSEIANVYLKEILSPGLFASINFGDKYPVTINGGYQQFPLLTKIGETENNVAVNRKGGFSGSIVVNIPLFTLYNDPED